MRKFTYILGIIAAVVTAAAFIAVTTVIIPSNNYKKAEELRAAGKYSEAVIAFTELGTYNDATMQVAATYYEEGESKRTNGDWTGAETAFENAGNYSDAAIQITETKYQHAQILMTAKDYAGAAAIFITIKGYKDVNNLLAYDQTLAVAAIAVTAATAKDPFTKVGSIVTYGQYEQDNNKSNGKEAIEWIVLKYDSATGRSLLLSRYGLDAHRFDSKYYQGWDKSEIRSWLNSTFLNTAFTESEQKGIVTTRISTPSYREYSGGSDTEDMIWLLS